jgi:serine/threonine protein kinase
MYHVLLQELCQKIMAGTYNAPEWLSSGAKDLLSRMMTLDPEQRITLEQVSRTLFYLALCKLLFIYAF